MKVHSQATKPTGSAALPRWRSALAVVAHPDDESFGLGAVLDTFNRSGTTTVVLCFTPGDASTLRAVPGDLAEVRRAELTAAGRELGVAEVVLLGYPDGQLAAVSRSELAGHVADVAGTSQADGLVVFDPSGVSGHPDHVAATKAALSAAEDLDLPVLGWTIPAGVANSLNAEDGATFEGHRPEEVDISLTVDRRRHLTASKAHVSQAVPESVLWRRLELQGDVELLRWLRRPRSA